MSILFAVGLIVNYYKFNKGKKKQKLLVGKYKLYNSIGVARGRGGEGRHVAPGATRKEAPNGQQNKKLLSIL